MNRKSIGKEIFFGILITLTLVSAGFAEEFRGTITGTVTDPNGASIPGATVTVKNIETNITVTVKSNDDGNYTVPALISGNYSVSATGTGFKTSTRENIGIRVDDRLTVDFKLEIGSTAEVTIVATDEVLERGTVTTGILISSRQVQELPLPEGAVFTLTLQSPGIVYTGDPNFTGPTANGNLAGFRTNGTAGNLINLDGSPNLGSNAAVAFTPPADAVQEFKVNTNSFDAQSGFTAGSTVNVALKSGTNKLHGAAYYFNRDRTRTANNFFNNREGKERPERKYYRWGGTLNGPVYVPKIYDGRDKTFFLFSMERQNDNVAQPTDFFVPTEKQRRGDFSELLAIPTPTLIYNPFTPTTGGTCPTGNVCRTPFTGNIIPNALLKQYALNYLALYPLPNLPVVDGIGRYTSDMNLHRPYKSYLGRIDHNFTDSQKVFGKYYYSKSQEDRYNWIGEPDSPTRGFEYRVNKGGNLDYTAMLGSRFILDVRGSYNLFSLRRANANPISPAELGLPGSVYGDAQVMPRMDFTSFASTAIPNAIGSMRADYGEGRLVPFNLFSLQPIVTQITGNHTLKYGYDYRQLHEQFNSRGFNAGRFTFDGTYTTQCASQSSAGGFCVTGGNNAISRSVYGRDLAAFLVGLPSANTNSLIDNPTAYNVKSNYHGFFVQDDWRVTSKLTLNLGLRYELEGAIYDSENRIVTGFDNSSANPLQAAAQANFAAIPPANVPTSFGVRGGLLFADGNNRAAQKPDTTNLQPRIGVSYAINYKTVIRGAFAIFTAPFQIQPPNQTGFSNPTLFVPSTNNGLTFIATLDNPFPSGVAPSPGSSQGLATSIGRDLTVLSHDRRNAQFTRFVLGLQRELPFGLAFEAAFVGARGADLAVARPINYIPKQYLNTATPAFDSTVNTFLTAMVANPFRGLVPSNGTYNAATITRRSLLTPFPEFGNITQTEYNGSNSYYSLQLQLIKRFTKGLSLNASYTRSRERESLARLNPWDEELTEQIAANDRPDRFTFSAIYELPIGRNRAVGKDWNRAVNALLGGWQIQTNYEWQSGEPLLFGNVFFSGDPGSLKSRIGGKDEQGRRYGVDIPAFDITGFYPVGQVFNGATAPGSINVGNNNTQAANTARYFPLATQGLRNQRFLSFNVGMSKNFHIREGMKFQIRVEAVNLLNNPYFSAPSLNPSNVPDLDGVAPHNENLGRFGFTSKPTRQPPRDIQIGARFTF